MSMRDEVETTIEALGSAGRKSDAALVELARRYADSLDAPSGVMTLDTIGPKLANVIDRLARNAGHTTTRRQPGSVPGALPPGVAELEEMRKRRAGA